jgi:Ca-activated chloride channel family protein
MLSFQYIEFFYGLLLLLPLSLFFLLVLRWKRKSRAAMGDAELVKQLTKQYSPKLFALKCIIVLLALALAIAASTNPRVPSKSGKEVKAGIDVMVALDVSKSMWAQDAKPTRLDKAKLFVSQLITQLGDNRVGLVIFAGRAYLQMPLTSDVGAAAIFLSNASPDAVPVQGTEIGEALQLCNNSLDTKEKKYKAVILISDGEDHDPKSEAVLQQLYDEGVVVHTIGVGSNDGSPILEPGSNGYKRDAEGQTVISKLNELELRTIAQKTGGQYHHLDDVGTVANEVVQLLNGMEKKAIDAGQGERQYTSYYIFLLLPALLLLALEIFIPERKIIPA